MLAVSAQQLVSHEMIWVSEGEEVVMLMTRGEHVCSMEAEVLYNCCSCTFMKRFIVVL